MPACGFVPRAVCKLHLTDAENALTVRLLGRRRRRFPVSRPRTVAAIQDRRPAGGSGVEDRGQEWRRVAHGRIMPEPAIIRPEVPHQRMAGAAIHIMALAHAAGHDGHGVTCHAVDADGQLQDHSRGPGVDSVLDGLLLLTQRGRVVAEDQIAGSRLPREDARQPSSWARVAATPSGVPRMKARPVGTEAAGKRSISWAQSKSAWPAASNRPRRTTPRVRSLTTGKGSRRKPCGRAPQVGIAAGHAPDWTTWPLTSSW